MPGPGNTERQNWLVEGEADANGSFWHLRASAICDVVVLDGTEPRRYGGYRSGWKCQCFLGEAGLVGEQRRWPARLGGRGCRRCKSIVGNVDVSVGRLRGRGRRPGRCRGGIDSRSSNRPVHVDAVPASTRHGGISRVCEEETLTSRLEGWKKPVITPLNRKRSLGTSWRVRDVHNWRCCHARSQWIGSLQSTGYSSAVARGSGAAQASKFRQDAPER